MFPSRPNQGVSSLCAAARFGNLDCCRELVSIGADIDFDGHHTGSPLAVAISLSSLKVVKYLINAGASMVYYSSEKHDIVYLRRAHNTKHVHIQQVLIIVI